MAKIQLFLNIIKKITITEHINSNWRGNPPIIKIIKHKSTQKDLLHTESKLDSVKFNYGIRQ